MKYRELGNSGIKVSVVGHGTWALGGDFFGEVDLERGIRAIQKSVELGVNLIDTAPAYGQNFEAETAVGKAVKGMRDKVVISTKCGVHRIMGEYVRCLSPMVVRQELENSLRRLQTDYIDVYFIHWPDMNFGIDGALDLLAEFKKEGKIRTGGVSNFNVEQIGIAEKRAGISCVQPPCSLFNRSSIANGIMPYCAEHNIGIMTYGSLGGGILTGKMKNPIVNGGAEQRAGFYDFFYEPMWTACNKVLDVERKIAQERGVEVAEVSINWVLAQPGVTTALVGPTDPEHAAKNVKCAEWELTAEELAMINEAYNTYVAPLQK